MNTTMTSEELIKNTDIQRIATLGAAVYEKIKSQYEPEYHGEFLAVDIDSKDVYLAKTSAEAVAKARADYPDHIFYVKKIGFDAAETMAHLLSKK